MHRYANKYIICSLHICTSSMCVSICVKGGMWACMFSWAYVYVCMCACMFACACACVCIRVHVYVYICVCMCASILACVHVRASMCTCVYMPCHYTYTRVSPSKRGPTKKGSERENTAPSLVNAGDFSPPTRCRRENPRDRGSTHSKQHNTPC